MDSREALVGARVRVLDSHRIAERRGKVGTVVGRYGGAGHVAVDVRLADGLEMLFWPRDLEEVGPARPPRRRSLLRRAGMP